MQRKALLSLAVALALGCASSAFAQDNALDGVTMRVLDDVRDIDAVVLDIDDDLDEGTEGDGADRDGQEGRDRSTSDRDAAADGEGENGDRGEDRNDDRNDRDDLEDADDERGEGQLEDRDVERDPAAEEPSEEPTGDDVA